MLCSLDQLTWIAFVAGPSLLSTHPVSTLHHDVLKLHGHREARVDLEADGSGAGVGGVGVVSGLGAV